MTDGDDRFKPHAPGGALTPAPRETARIRQSIRILPEPIVARIAAGEVIEHPASVVKELVENALDAGARQIRIDVQGGGLHLIRVGDDGIGIPWEELPLACQRHATSKLQDADLRTISTLGFRGEALPSIAAVAELTILSSADASGIGRRITLCERRVVMDEPAPRTRGTTVTARNLFQNVPARLSMLERQQPAISQIAQSVRRLALVAPEVALSLFADDRLLFQTSGSGDLEATMVEVYGPSIAGSLFPLGPVDVGATRIGGLIGGPELTRPGRRQINLIINGRWVQPRGLMAMLEAAYRPLLPRGRHPILALVIETPPDEVDVNIHPAKLDVRLLAEREIGAALADLVRSALGQRPLPFQLSTSGEPALLPGPTAVAEDAPTWDDDAPIITPRLPPLRIVGQVHDRLILLEAPDGLYLVDQHRAHERILYERLAEIHSQPVPESVALPEPLLLEVRASQAATIARRLEDLAGLGFRCEVFGDRTFLLRAAPALPGVLPDAASGYGPGLGESGGITGAILEGEDDEAGPGESWRDRLLVRLACRTAVRRGRPLDRRAMRWLVEMLGHTSAPVVCPHGAPLLMHVSADVLGRQFRW